MSASEQQKTFVSVFLEEGKRTGNYAEAADKAKEVAGYSPNTKFSHIIDSENVKNLFLEGVSVELLRIVPKLLHRLEQVIDTPAMPGAKNIIAAAATLLDRGGVTKVEKSEVEVKVPDGVLILPPKNNHIEKE